MAQFPWSPSRERYESASRVLSVQLDPLYNHLDFSSNRFSHFFVSEIIYEPRATAWAFCCLYRSNCSLRKNLCRTRMKKNTPQHHLFAIPTKRASASCEITLSDWDCCTFCPFMSRNDLDYVPSSSPACVWHLQYVRAERANTLPSMFNSVSTKRKN